MWFLGPTGVVNLTRMWATRGQTTTVSLQIKKGKGKEAHVAVGVRTVLGPRRLFLSTGTRFFSSIFFCPRLIWRFIHLAFQPTWGQLQFQFISGFCHLGLNISSKVFYFAYAEAIRLCDGNSRLYVQKLLSFRYYIYYCVQHWSLVVYYCVSIPHLIHAPLQFS
jgi:hypothetical protein